MGRLKRRSAYFKTLMKASSTNTSYEASFAADDKTKLASMEGGKGEDKFFYNSRTQECCGRNGSSFLSTIAYLAIFAASVAAFFGLCLWVFYQTLDNYEPKLQTTSSFIGANPGLGYRPMLQDADPYSSLIWFKHGGAGDWQDLKLNLDQFLTEYEPGFW